VIGERAAYTWFVLKYLLGYPNVKSYDASWLEWDNTIGNPIKNKKISLMFFFYMINIKLYKPANIVAGFESHP